MHLPKWKATLERAHVTFASGLSSAELSAAENVYRLRFPPDLRELLMFAMPLGESFPNWRDLDSAQIRDQLTWPLEGMHFDIEHNNFWLESWGARPEKLETAFQVASQHVEAAPRLVPVCGHRYLPDRPHAAGNPVFSVYQTDIIYYGADLENYYENEFPYWFGTQHQLPDAIRVIAFWSELVELS